MLKPNRKDYQTASALHSAMTTYARALDKPRAHVSVVYSDGSVFTDIFECATKEVKYMVGYAEEAEDYYVTVDTGLFNPDYLYNVYDVTWGTCKPLNYTQLKKKFAEWIQDNVEKPVSILWSKE